MRPFFRYYGGKWKNARNYGPPRRPLVIEPFAGSAGYSVRHNAPVVKLYDTCPNVCAVWDFLIKCSDDDLRRIPDRFAHNDEWRALPDGPRQLVFYNVRLQARIGDLPDWFIHYGRTGEKTGWISDRKMANGNVRNYARCQWGPERKARILAQKPLLRGWSIEQRSYTEIPDQDAHWHVDPPYQGTAGRRYKENAVDYADLAAFCRTRTGAVDVCEQEGADWLPFRVLYDMNTQNPERRSVEVVWRKDQADLLDAMGAASRQ